MSRSMSQSKDSGTCTWCGRRTSGLDCCEECAGKFASLRADVRFSKFDPYRARKELSKEIYEAQSQRIRSIRPRILFRQFVLLFALSIAFPALLVVLSLAVWGATNTGVGLAGLFAIPPCLGAILLFYCVNGPGDSFYRARQGGGAMITLALLFGMVTVYLPNTLDILRGKAAPETHFLSDIFPESVKSRLCFLW